MMESLANLTIGLMTITSAALMLFHNWRYCILALAFQYVGVFILVSLSWSLEMAVVKLLTGWVAGAILGLVFATESNLSVFAQTSQIIEEQNWINGRFFRLFFMGLILFVIWSIAPGMLQWEAGIYPQQIYGGLVLMAMGTLQVSLTGQPFRVVIGLLTFLSGAEILYAGIEGSVLVAGLFSFINLALAMTGAYLMIVHSMETSV